MTIWLLTGLLLAAPKPIKVAVSEVETGLGVDPLLTHFVSTLVTSELRRRPALAVTSQEDVKNLLGFAKQKALLGCLDATCLAEIGGALGVEQIVTGSMAKLGESLVLVLRVIDVHHSTVVRDVTRRLRNASQDALLDALPGAVAQLYPDLMPQAPPAALAEAKTQVVRSATPWWLAGAGAVVALVGGGLIIGEAISGQSRAAPSGGTSYGISWQQAQTANAIGYVGEALAIAGVGFGLGGLGWGLFRPSPAPEAAP